MEVNVSTPMEVSCVNVLNHALEPAMHVAVVHALKVALVSVIILIVLHVCAHLGSLDQRVLILKVSIIINDMF